MSDLQAGGPVKDNPAAVVDTAKGETLLTGGEEGTTSLTGGVTLELPHAWMNGMTTEQKADADLIKAVSKFEKGIPDLVGSYAELEKKQSQAVSVPNETATEEEKARYRKAIGVPEKPEDYKLEQVELPDRITTDEAMQKQFLQIAHGAGLNDGQLNAIHQWYMKTIGEQIVAAQKVVKTSMEEAETYIQKKYGTEAAAATTYMERGFKEIATPAITELFIRTGIGNHPDLIEKCISLGKRIGEHGFVDGSRGEHLETGTVGERSDEQIAAVLYPTKEGQ